MRPVSANFEFLQRHGSQLFRLAALAERYFRTDPNTCLIKLRQYAGLSAKDVAARAGLLHAADEPSPQFWYTWDVPARRIARACWPP